MWPRVLLALALTWEMGEVSLTPLGLRAQTSRMLGQPSNYRAIGPTDGPAPLLPPETHRTPTPSRETRRGKADVSGEDRQTS